MDTNINISEVVKNLVSAAEKEINLIIPPGIDSAIAAAEQYKSNLFERGTALLNVVADPDFKGDKLAFVVARLKDEKQILETEVFSFIIIGAGVAQNIVNGIQNIIISAIQAILPDENVS